MPTRYLKAEICDSETLDSLNPLAEVLFYRLLVTVDDFGRLDARSSFIKAKCFPVRDSVTAKDVEKLLQEMHDKSVISLYEVESRRYLQLSKWTNKPRADVSKYPSPINGCIQVYTDEKQCKANPPVTVTETVTVTSSRVQSLTLPDWLPETLIDEFKSHRVKLKKPMTGKAVELLVGELVKLHDEGYDAVACLETAMVSGWLKPYQPKEKPQSTGKFDINEWMKTK